MKKSGASFCCCSNLLPPLLLLLVVLSVTCECASPVRRDACHPNPCQNGGSCTVVELLEGESFSCSCVGGNRNKDDLCRQKPKTTPAPESNPCQPNPCEADGECYEDPFHEFSDSGLDFYCECTTDRTGDTCKVETGRPKDDFDPFA